MKSYFPVFGQVGWQGILLMSKSYVLTHKYRPALLFTFGVNSLFLDILDVLHVDLTELSQEEVETLLGTLSILHPEITVKSEPASNYVMRYQ